MERLYYVECEHETLETRDKLEAARVVAEWTERGEKVDTVVVDAANGREEGTPDRRDDASVARRLRAATSAVPASGHESA